MCVPPDSPGLHQGGVDGGSSRSWDTEGVSHIPKDPLSASDIDILNGFRKTHPHTADRQIILPDSDSPFPFIERKGTVTTSLQSFRRASVSSRNFHYPRLAGEICLGGRDSVRGR